MPNPPRRTEPRKQLDAHVLPVEQALLARAGVLDQEAHAEEVPTIGGAVKLLVSQEFRALAEELRFW